MWPTYINSSLQNAWVTLATLVVSTSDKTHCSSELRGESEYVILDQFNKCVCGGSVCTVAPVYE